jgi:hypothetical protein
MLISICSHDCRIGTAADRGCAVCYDLATHDGYEHSLEESMVKAASQKCLACVGGRWEWNAAVALNKAGNYVWLCACCFQRAWN